MLNLLTANQNITDVVFLEQESLWHCCGVNPDTGGADCSFPQDQTQQLIPPDVLQTIGTAGATAQPTSTLDADATSHLSAPSTSSATAVMASSVPPSAGGLSVGAQVGIGVGAAVGAIAFIIVAIAALAVRKRRSARRADTNLAPSAPSGTSPWWKRLFRRPWESSATKHGSRSEIGGNERNEPPSARDVHNWNETTGAAVTPGELDSPGREAKVYELSSKTQ